MYKSILFCFVLLFLSERSFSQKSYQAGALTQINLNLSVAKKLKLNTKLESRQLFSQREYGEMRNNKLTYERTDLAFVLSRKMSANNTLGGGYLVRLEDRKLTHRLIQQFSSVREYDNLIVAHRLVTDETFSRDEPTEIRIRYRLGLEKALSGRIIDPKEFYAKANNEYLAILADQTMDYEIRGALALGYNAKDENKIELGIEYRINEFNQDVNVQQYWVTVGWYLSI